MKTSLVLFLILFTALRSFSQVSLILYNLSRSVPQSSQLNPALQPDGKFFIGLPVISGVAMSWKSDLAMTDFVQRGPDDSMHISLNRFTRNLRKNERIRLDADISLLQVGFRAAGGYFIVDAGLKNSAGFSLSRNTLELLTLGNGADGILGKKIDLRKEQQDAISYYKIGLGYSRTFLSGKITGGARVNILRGIIALTLDARKAGYLYTNPESYYITLDAGNMKYNTSGYESYLNGSFNTSKLNGFSNMGVGMDLGAVWNVNDHWKISGSLTDLGAIYWNSDTRNYSLHQKSYIFQGIQVDALNNFNNFSDSLNAIFKPDTSYNNFKTTLKSKLYLQSSFDFGKGNQVSLISRNIFYRNGIVNTTMVSYHKRVGRALDCSVGYSVFDLRYSQLGAGFAVNLGGVNLYLVSDNMLAFFHPENNHSADFVFGINVNFLDPR